MVHGAVQLPIPIVVYTVLHAGMCPHWSVVVSPTTTQASFAPLCTFDAILTKSNHHSDHPGHIPVRVYEHSLILSSSKLQVHIIQ